MNISPELTLKDTLFCLSERHSLSEVLDRLAEVSDFYAQTASPCKAADWHQLAKTLESATQQAKKLEG
jgi:hypothetical protein